MWVGSLLVLVERKNRVYMSELEVTRSKLESNEALRYDACMQPCPYLSSNIPLANSSDLR
jgi:hypothetical protein